VYIYMYIYVYVQMFYITNVPAATIESKRHKLLTHGILPSVLSQNEMIPLIKMGIIFGEGSGLVVYIYPCDQMTVVVII